jgi:hypothetical protein
LFTVVLTVGHSVTGSDVCAAASAVEGEVRMAARKRKVIVVGAGSGIGAAVATHFHDSGNHVPIPL